MDTFYFLMTLAIPLVMVVSGLWMFKKPPRKMNWALGYRTERSMKSQQAWDFAQTYCGRFLFLSGLPVMFASTLLFFALPFPKVWLCLALTCWQLVMLALSIVPTEKELKKQFDENGNRR